MLPQRNDGLKSFEIRKYPTKTYRIDNEKGIIKGYTDGIEAMEQAIYKILCTDRFVNIIYSWNYGSELNNILGRSREFVYSEIQRRIKEALLEDDRITNVHSFEFSYHKSTVSVTFRVETTEGATEITKGVKVDV